MEFFVLRSDWDVLAAQRCVADGRAVWVEVDFEIGPDGPEPKVELLRLLLDQVQRRFAVEDRQYVPHPFVPRRYLHSCVIQPTPPPGRSSGVREPRVPRPDPNVSAAAIVAGALGRSSEARSGRESRRRRPARSMRIPISDPDCVRSEQ